MIRLYTMDNCQYCNNLKKLLKADNIEYVEVNVGHKENEDEFKVVYEITGSDNVPTMKIGKQLFAPDVSFSSIQEAFDLAKKFGGS